MDRDKNPEYVDQLHVYVKCLNKKGRKVKELPDAGGWNYVGPDNLTPAQEEKIEIGCKTETFHVAKG